MSYNDLWARALSYAYNHRMPDHRAAQFAHEYARAVEDLALGGDCDVLSPELFHRLVGHQLVCDHLIQRKVNP